MIDLRTGDKPRVFILEGSSDGEDWLTVARIDETIIAQGLWRPGGTEYFLWNYTRSRWDPPRRAPRQ